MPLLPERMNVKNLSLPIAVVSLLTACASSPAARIREHAAEFAALSSADQQRIRQGRIDVGCTRAMVNLALGKPSEIIGEKWIFRNYYPDPSVNHESLYARNDSSAGSVRDRVGTVGAVSDPNAGQAGEGVAGVEPAVLEVWLSDGRVRAFRVVP